MKDWFTPSPKYEEWAGRRRSTHSRRPRNGAFRMRTRNLRRSLSEKSIRVRETGTRKRYEALLSGEQSLARKIAHLAEIRNKEGYMATWEKEEGGSYLLIENHCPICAAASACTGFCRSEKAIFE